MKRLPIRKLATLLFLLGGLVAAVVLVRQEQELREEAEEEKYLVKPYLVYPADKPMYLEYEEAVKNYLVELQEWYQEKVGATFRIVELRVLRTSADYLTMRCGENPSQECTGNPGRIDGNSLAWANKAIHGVEKWEEQTAALVFVAGAGGHAGSNVYENHAAFAYVGDWVLEPLSGVANEWGIPCNLSDGWQCAGGVPKGSPAHELGHAFGLPHPDEYEGQSIMKWHGDYPEVGFLPHEVEFLRQSPFFATPTPSPKALRGDLDQDGDVDIFDYNLVVSHFGSKKPPSTPADIDRDGDVDIFDFNIVVSNFGQSS